MASKPMDPFQHEPVLRDKIVAPEDSAYRGMDAATMMKQMAAVGVADWLRPKPDRERSRRAFLNERRDRDLWVFAYGSLMWDPAFQFAEVRRGEISGYHRRFCLLTVLGRGSPDRPGLMAGLDAGGSCQGILFRVEASAMEPVTKIIWAREMLLTSYRCEIVEAQTPQGVVEAIAFVADPEAKNYVGKLSLEETAKFVGTGKGVYGPNLAYVENLVDHFMALELVDEELSALCALAQQISADTS